MKRSAIAFTLVALLCSGSFAQDQKTRERREYGRGNLAVKDPAEFTTEGKQIFSGPQPGEKLLAFQATSLAGDNKGKALDPIKLAGDHPQILIFQDEGRAGIRGLFGVVDVIAKIDRKSDKDLHITSVFLSDDAEGVSQSAGRFSSTLLERGLDVISISKDGRDGPGAYGLNRNVSQTIILAKDGIVTRSFVFTQGLLYADPHVIGGVAELIGEKRETVAAWLNESAQRGDAPQAAAKLALREKLGKFVTAGKLTREEAGELYRAAFPERERARGDRSRESTERNQRDRDKRRDQQKREGRESREGR